VLDSIVPLTFRCIRSPRSRGPGGGRRCTCTSGCHSSAEKRLSVALCFRLHSNEQQQRTKGGRNRVIFRLKNPKASRRGARRWRTHPLGRLDDDVPAAVGDRYDVLPAHRVGRPRSAKTGGWSVVKRQASSVEGRIAKSKSGAAALRSSHLRQQKGVATSSRVWDRRGWRRVVGRVRRESGDGRGQEGE
jgi:hypothetical protein